MRINDYKTKRLNCFQAIVPLSIERVFIVLLTTSEYVSMAFTVEQISLFKNWSVFLQILAKTNSVVNVFASLAISWWDNTFF